MVTFACVAFFLLLSLSSLLLAFARLAPLLPFLAATPLPWTALGRAAGQLLQTQALAVACGAPSRAEVFQVGTVMAMQWLQLGISSVSSEVKLHWGLFATGILCGFLGQSSLEALLARSTHSASIKQRLTLILSFAWTMNMLTTSWWFVMETLGPAGYHLGKLKISPVQNLIVIVSLDLLLFSGVSHLLLKRERHEMLQEICCNISKQIA